MDRKTNTLQSDSKPASLANWGIALPIKPYNESGDYANYEHAFPIDFFVNNMFRTC